MHTQKFPALRMTALIRSAMTTSTPAPTKRGLPARRAVVPCRRAALMVAAGALALAGTAAVAGEGSRGAPAHAGYQAECGSCHLAYPPRLLPAPSWRQVMGSLDRHFGTDASVDAALARDIGAWLEANAGSPRRGADPAQPRITRTAWFLHEHDEVPPDAWRRPAVGSAANCAACHTQAESGDYRKRNLRIPR
jgi:hypothetical protein